ncbi:MAG: lytic murein transglycosylase [Geminicoccaceae bacterium]|nr:lytic murein transglycosylase [Geminicoccaceae bacterium]MCS7268450.1 lytic murein transglycosylase [Geminicoccaceae bacterium]MCX7631066.1 lytic murein transglycosylase [Geminicoccaceae bacterium]MDW8124898.1 lytic murein transglycosylase [Geminicoccaceae bacterium]MDW8340946.1 lytic murein transglycosylase [Geminicoccaceae bacterium]
MRAEEPSFAVWLEAFKAEARARGVSAATLERAFSGVRPLLAVLEADRRQPERRLRFTEYLERVVNEARIRRGRELAAVHRPLLERVRMRFGVPAPIVVALWGIESSYGTRTGEYRVIDALATLAWEGRRAELFRKELFAALEILERGEREPHQLLGSWAGAMGQCQFLPSSYLAHAIDFDGDGRRDIWTSLPDVFGSIGQYLARAGWWPGERWGRAVRPSKAIDPALDGLERRLPLSEWSHRGIRALDGGPLPALELEASLLRPEGESGPAFLVYRNFRTLMAWNRSTYFALSVGLLADRLAEA